MEWRLGGMGYAYSDWKRVFYSEKCAPSDWLGEYSRQFDCVELNVTFHAVPAIEVWRRWFEQTGENFRFAVKAPRAVTHDRPLRDGVELFTTFLKSAMELGTKLGPVVLQLPPHVTVDALPDLERLLARTPDRVAMAVEFRSDTWRRDEVYDALTKYRAACVAAEHEDHPAGAEIVPTSDFNYVRLVGKHGRFDSEDRERFDPTPLLKQWHERLTRAAARVSTTWVMFNNDLAGHAPASLRRFAHLAGVPAGEPPVVRMERQRLLFD